VAIVVLACGIALACGAVFPGPVAAQTVTGTVVTEDGGIPVAGARIWLIRDDQARVDSTRANAAGRYTLHAPSPGTYVLYVEIPGYASETISHFELAAGQTLRRDVQYRLVSLSAMQIMGDALDADTMLQRHLPELCGEDPRPWETGLIVGVIRDRPTGDPIPHAVVMVQPPATPDSTPTPRTRVSNQHGTYVFCNVPPGDKVLLRVRAPGHRPETQTVQVRVGMIGWYDVYMYRSRKGGR